MSTAGARAGVGIAGEGGDAGAARWAASVESLVQDAMGAALTCDVLVIGSGYGGSFAARELAGTGVEVWMVERGREYALGDFPEDIGQLPGHVRLHRSGSRGFIGDADALLDVRSFDDVSVLVANGLGGGSLINAGVAVVPDESVLRDRHWPAAYRSDAGRRKALLAAMQEASESLRAQPLDGASSLRKFEALDVLASRVGTGERAVPMKVTIASRAGESPAGLHQDACIRCGNCFTGCNTGAKNTLVSHVLPLAVRNGARLFTGGTALSLRPATHDSGLTGAGRPVRWAVDFAFTATSKDRSGADFRVHAHTVLVCAGTLGSTELLLRSPALEASPMLGKRFSTNGDVIAMGWGMEPMVDGMSAPTPTDAAVDTVTVGPTIVGAISTRLDDGTPVLIEDGAIPSALSQVAIALGSLLSFGHRYTSDDLPAALGKGIGVDPIRVPSGIGRRALLLLGMGKDSGTGCIALGQPHGSDRGYRPLQVEWPARTRGAGSYYARFHELLQDAAGRGGLQGGDYLTNPLWQPLPDGFSAITGEPARGLVTVHPLGGCPMGDTAADGVVDWSGAVFRKSGGVYAGLHVLDGSIVPGAIGVNPFITISGLSLLAARHVRAALGDAQSPPRPALPWPVSQPRALARPMHASGPVTLQFKERLQGESVGAVPPWLQRLVQSARKAHRLPPRDGEDRAWVVQVTVDLDVDAWLADPSTSLDAHLEVFDNYFAHELSVKDEVTRGTPLLKGQGKVTLLAHDAPADEAEWCARAREALCTYIRRRTIGDLDAVGSGGSLIQGAKSFWRVARNLAHRRTLDYVFELQAPAQAGLRVEAKGSKRLAYARNEKNLWDALTELDLHVSDGREKGRLRVRVDLIDMVQRRRLQVKSAPNTPAGIVAVAAFAGLWVRALFQSHFWSFRGLNYDRLALPGPAAHGPLRPHGIAEPAVEPKRIPLEVAKGPGAKQPFRIELTRYEPLKRRANGPHVLLIHGLAHGGPVFTTATVGANNMATAFLAEGYTVWVLDHRLSNRFTLATDHDPTIDDLAHADIGCAVDHVYREAGNKPIHVFAHCVGAAAFSIAVLSGRLDAREPGGEHRSKVGAAIIHAVHPWVLPSISNQFSAALAALYKDVLDGKRAIDPLPPRGRGAMVDEFLDRLGGSLPWPDEELRAHEAHRYSPAGGCAVCNRMTVFYGREWKHGNLAAQTHAELASLVGPAGLEVFRQLYFFAVRQRLTARHGANEYVTLKNFGDHWSFPVLFCHGRDNKVFDPRSAVRSWNRLWRSHVLNQQPDANSKVKLFIADGYGHMDFLFGKNAHRDVYPRLLDFFRDTAAFRSTWGADETDADKANEAVPDDLQDHNNKAPRSVPVGPAIELDWPDAAAGTPRRLVLWFEQRFDSASAPRFPRLLKKDEPEQALSMAGWESALAPTRTGGYFWTGSLTEDPAQGVIFARLAALKLMIETGGSIPDIVEMAKARAAVKQLVSSRLVPGISRIGVPHDQTVFSGRLRRRDPALWTQLFAHVQNGPDLQQERSEPRTPRSPPIPELPTYDEEVPPILDLSGFTWWRRWTGQSVTAPVSWLALSCRWPGTPFEREAVDALASHMAAHVEHADRPVDALVMLGDQIYADATADVADTSEPEERGVDRYRDAWAERSAAQRLMSSVPSYLVVDDHEISDNWSGVANPASARAFELGFDAASAYQWRYRPDDTDLPKRGVRGFWKEFRIGGVPAFAADTRTERQLRTGVDWATAEMMSSAQQLAIERWLLKHRDVPKVLCSGSVFGVPERALLADSARCRHDDTWLGYPGAWNWLASFLAQNGIRDTILLSGDYHLSAIAELEILAVGAAAPVRAVSVVCSGWNASLPFANMQTRDFVEGQAVLCPLGAPGVQLWSTMRVVSDAQRQFSKLTLAKRGGDWVLSMATYGESGKLLTNEPVDVRL